MDKHNAQIIDAAAGEVAEALFDLERSLPELVNQGQRMHAALMASIGSWVDLVSIGEASQVEIYRARSCTRLFLSQLSEFRDRYEDITSLLDRALDASTRARAAGRSI